MRFAIVRLSFIALTLIPGVSKAANFTLTFQGHSKLVKGYGLPFFPRIGKLKVVFTGPTALPKGKCTQLQATLDPLGWSVNSFSDGSNTYSPSGGFTSSLSPPWSSTIDWAFEACLDSAGKLTSFSGDFIAYTQAYIDNDDYGVFFVSGWGETPPVGIVVGYGTPNNPEQTYEAQYGFSIGIDNVYNAQNAIAFDGYNTLPPTISYKK